MINKNIECIKYNINFVRNNLLKTFLFLLLCLFIYIGYIVYRRIFHKNLIANECYSDLHKRIWYSFQEPIINQTKYNNLPLKDFFIMSSHNTYLPCAQNIAISYEDSVLYVLKMGVRCIEFDVFDYKGLPIVAHGTKYKGRTIYSTNKVSFENIVKIVSKNAWRQTSDPLIFYIELNAESEFDKIKNILDKYFGQRYISDNYKNNKGSVINAPIKDLTNKVILITNNRKNHNLDNVFDGFFDGPIDNYSSKSALKQLDKLKNVTRNNLIRVYPSPTRVTIFSGNKDSFPFMDSGVQIIGMNIQGKDENTRNYLKFFSDSSFIPKSKYKQILNEKNI